MDNQDFFQAEFAPTDGGVSEPEKATEVLAPEGKSLPPNRSLLITTVTPGETFMPVSFEMTVQNAKTVTVEFLDQDGNVIGTPELVRLARKFTSSRCVNTYKCLIGALASIGLHACYPVAVRHFIHIILHHLDSLLLMVEIVLTFYTYSIILLVELTPSPPVEDILASPMQYP